MEQTTFSLLKMLPWWIWLIVGIGIITPFIQFIRKIRGGDSFTNNNYKRQNSFSPQNYILRETLMTPVERIFFEKLRIIIGDKYDIYPQVNLDKIFKTKYQNSKTAFNAAKWVIDRRSIDFLITIKDTQRPYIGIELDDSTHYREDRVSRDEKINALFKENGIELMRVYGPNGISEEELMKKFS